MTAKFSVHIGRIRVVFRVVSALAAVFLVLSLICSISMLLSDHSLLAPIVPEDSEPFPPPGILPILHLGSILASLALLALSTAVWLFWLTTSSKFVRKAGAREMRFSPVTSAVYHFVPVIAYVMPMLVLVELEAATRNPNDWKEVSPSRLAGTTWLVAKLSAIAFLSTFNLPDLAETADQYIRGVALISMSSVLVLGGLLLANLFMRHMTKLQERLFRPRLSGPPNKILVASSLDGFSVELRRVSCACPYRLQ
jgi:hypothetical protein